MSTRPSRGFKFQVEESTSMYGKCFALHKIPPEESAGACAEIIISRMRLQILGPGIEASPTATIMQNRQSIHRGIHVRNTSSMMVS